MNNENFKLYTWSFQSDSLPFVKRVVSKNSPPSFKGAKKFSHHTPWIMNYSYNSINEYYKVPPLISKWTLRAPLEFHIYSPNLVFYEKYPNRTISHSTTILIQNGEALGLGDICGDKGFAMGFDSDRRIGEILSAIVEIGVERQENGFWAVQSLLFSLIDYLNGFKPKKNNKLFIENLEEAKLSEKVNTYLREHIGEKLQLSKISKHFNMSVSSLTHKYLDEEKASIMKRFMAFRMNHAERLLLSGESVATISEKTGFCNTFNFSRAFKKHFGMSPLNYRKKQLF